MINRRAALFIGIPIALGLASFNPLRSQPRPTRPEPPPPVIRVGTRLVEVEVVVRDMDGPVTGLTRDDFTLLDQGKKQKIAEFRAGANAQQPPVPLPAGTVSNRTDLAGHPIAGATVLLLDLLNTSLDNQGYARGELLKYLESG